MLNIEMKAKNYEIGDQISIKLPKYGEFTATVEKVEANRVLFIFDQVVARRQMNSSDTNEGGFKETELYRWLQDELLPLFPEELKNYIGELTIPTIGQIVGHTDEWDNEHMESDEDEQLPLMRDVKHRIAALNNEIVCYWLQNASKSSWSAATFAYVYYYGDTDCSVASYSLGVRPAFWLGKNDGGLVPRSDMAAKSSSSDNSVEFLKEEIKSKTEEIALLHNKIKKLETTEMGKKAGEEVKAAMDGFVSAGFTEDQAFQLVILSILPSMFGR